MNNDGYVPTQEKLNELTETTAIRLHVLQRAIGALIVTHPDPAAFAREFAGATARAQVDHHLTSDAGAWRRKEAAEYAAGLLDLARAAAANLQTPGAS